MGFFEKLNEDLTKFKKLSTKEKISFLLEYYRIPIIIVVIIISLILSALVAVITKREKVLSGVVINSTNTSKETVNQFVDDALLFIGNDPEKTEVDLKTGFIYQQGEKQDIYANSATLNVLMAEIAGGTLDFVISDDQSMLIFAYSAYFCSLSEVLSDEQLHQYRDYILYIDGVVLKKFQEAVELEKYDVDIPIPDPAKPEEMGDPIPVFIDLSNTQCADVFPLNNKGKLLLAAAESYPHQQLVSFINFLLNNPDSN